MMNSIANVLQTSAILNVVVMATRLQMALLHAEENKQLMWTGEVFLIFWLNPGPVQSIMHRARAPGHQSGLSSPQV